MEVITEDGGGRQGEGGGERQVGGKRERERDITLFE